MTFKRIGNKKRSMEIILIMIKRSFRIKNSDRGLQLKHVKLKRNIRLKTLKRCINNNMLYDIDEFSRGEIALNCDVDEEEEEKGLIKELPCEKLRR